MQIPLRDDHECEQLLVLGSANVPVYVAPINDREFALFEGGISRDCDLFIEQLQARGIDLKAIRYWFISHKHYDHCGMLCYVAPLMPNVEIVASRATIESWQSASTRDVIDRLNATLGTPEIGRSCQRLDKLPVKAIDPGASFVAGNHLTVTAVATPGHSPDHTCFYDARRQRLFTGDCLGELDPVTRCWRPLIFDDAEAYLESLRALCKLPVREIVTAHHGILSPEGDENLIQNCLVHTQRCIQEIQAADCREGIVEQLHQQWHSVSAPFVPRKLHRSSMERMVDLILRLPLNSSGKHSDLKALM
ncbi:MBL fold metallo-hydrolase [Microbulbifer elongatus]|uniref:MBL fold metallo-hydrolase n=1 Tax=Microbulbifer elongatus TaxID=86173 RepID=UPI001E3D6A30|nr:MBL fold metallo-hydrolase [Microbulbifer elongatus]